MEKFLKDFEVENKNPSEEAIRRWRNAVALVKNPRRRFRFVADLAKRSEAEKKKLQIQKRKGPGGGGAAQKIVETGPNQALKVYGDGRGCSYPIPNV